MTNESLVQELSQEELSQIHGGCFDWVKELMEEAKEAIADVKEFLGGPDNGNGKNDTWTGNPIRDYITDGKYPML